MSDKKNSSSLQDSSSSNLGDFDVVIVGAGMAGASLAYEIAPHLRVLILEQESQPGHHATGRSAALFSEIYGNEVVRKLSRASRSFFNAPGSDFTEHALLTTRGTLFFAAAEQIEQLQILRDDVASRTSSINWIEGADLRSRLPALRPEAAKAALFENEACDIDVHALHQGYLRSAKRHGATVVCDAEVETATHSNSRWFLSSRAGECSATVLVNAAGAWADNLALLAGANTLGLTPLRRTAMVFEDHGTWNSKHWPLSIDIEEQLYFKPDAGHILASPADENLSAACDAQPDEFDVAVLLDRLERLTYFRPKRITGRWAGLRTFSHDRTPVAGFDPIAPNFFWLAGQGGYGIQTAPALAAFSASLILGRALPDNFLVHGVLAENLSAQRFTETFNKDR